MAAPSPIILLSGTPGAGKSTVGRALAERFAYGFHLSLDDLREFVVAGRADPVPTWTTETGRQFRLARRGACDLARRYAAAGFTVVIDDVVGLEAREQFDPHLEGCVFYKVALRPSLEVALERNRTRTNKPFDTGGLSEVIKSVYALQAPLERAPDWFVLDSSDLSVSATVAAILERLALEPSGG